MWRSRWTHEFLPLSANPLKCKSLSLRTISWIKILWNSRPQKRNSSWKKYAIVCLFEKQMEYQWPEHLRWDTQLICRQVKRANDRPKSRAYKLMSTAGTRTSSSTLRKSANAVNLLTTIKTTPKVNLTYQPYSTSQLKSRNAWPQSPCQRAQQKVRWWAELLLKRPKRQTTSKRCQAGVPWSKVRSTLDTKTTTKAVVTLRFRRATKQ